MEDANFKPNLNINAPTFEPRNTESRGPEETNQLSESGRSTEIARTVIDNGFWPDMLSSGNTNLSELMSRISASGNTMPQYMFMPSNQAQLAQQQQIYSQSLAAAGAAHPFYQPQQSSPVSGSPATGSIQRLGHNFLGMPHGAYMMPAVASPTAAVAVIPSVSGVPSAADRARRNSSCRSVKIFNTGDPEIDRGLAQLYKEVNPRTELGRLSQFVGGPRPCRFFVIKSFTEEHVHRAVKYGEWCSTQRGNDILDSAYRCCTMTAGDGGSNGDDATGHGKVLLFFSVNSSGYFCGVAQMTSPYEPTRQTHARWTVPHPNSNGRPWVGGFSVRWLYVKDVPNKYLRHIQLEGVPVAQPYSHMHHHGNGGGMDCTTESRPLTNCRDATEVCPAHKGYEALHIIHEYHHNSSLFDDFEIYETRERMTATTP